MVESGKGRMAAVMASWSNIVEVCGTRLLLRVNVLLPGLRSCSSLCVQGSKFHTTSQCTPRQEGQGGEQEGAGRRENSACTSGCSYAEVLHAPGPDSNAHRSSQVWSWHFQAGREWRGSGGERWEVPGKLVKHNV